MSSAGFFTIRSQNSHDLTIISKKGLSLLIKERFVTYYQGVLSPELGSPRTHGRAVPRVVTKSAKLHEELSDLEGRISMRVILELIDCIK